MTASTMKRAVVVLGAFLIVTLLVCIIHFPVNALTTEDLALTHQYGDVEDLHDREMSKAEIEGYLDAYGLDYYAYMALDTAEETLKPVILEARKRIIDSSSWVDDDLHGWVEDCYGNVVEVVPKFHDVFPEEWEIPTEYQ